MRYNMIKRNQAFLLGLSALFVSQIALAGDPVVSIPLNTFINPTYDLVDQNGTKKSISDLEGLDRQRVDLSKFNPVENKYWQNQKFPAIDTKLAAEMPASENAEVIYNESLGAYREAQLYSIYISPKNNPNQSYGLTFGLQIHSSLVKAALLRKLGIYQESPKHYLKIKVKFESVEKMNDFVQKAFLVEGSAEDNIDYLSLEPFQRGLLSDVNKEEKSLVIHDAYIEKLNPEVPSLFDGLTPATTENLSLFAQSRAFRSLIAPYVVADLGESLNRVSPQSATYRGGFVDMNFVNYFYFQNKTSHADMKWILRRMADLTDADWNEIVEAGAYPKQLKSLVHMKLMYRMKNLLENFFEKDEFKSLLKVTMPSLSINSGDGCVVDSKVMPICQNIPGYPQRWSHGDRQSPFETADLFKYIGIKSQAAAFKVGLSKLNEKIQLKKSKSRLTGIEISENGITPLGDAQGWALSASYNADRIITTGTFYGSQAPIQLVDNISISGGIGRFKTLFEKNAIMKSFGANVSYSRDYTYVTPIKTIDEAKKQQWSNLLGETKLDKLLAPLEEGKGLTGFLANMKNGEVFTVSDSVGIMGRAGISAVLDNLIGFSYLGAPSVMLSVDANKRVLLRQTQFVRTNEGIQVFIRDGSSKAFGVQFDFNYFVNLLKIRYQTERSDLHTEAYVLDYRADLMQKVESGELTDISDDLQKVVDAQNALSTKASEALLALIRQSNSWPIRENFKSRRYEITHGLKTKELQTSVFWKRATEMEEEHILNVYKPEMIAPDGSTVVNKALRFSLYSKGNLVGSDPTGFGVDILDAALAKKFDKNAPQFSQSSQNPSQSPYGSAYWRMVRSDADLNSDRSEAYPSVSTIEHVWSGWEAKKEEIQGIIQKLRESLKDIKVAGNATIPDGALYHTKKIDFYRITSHLTLLPEAVETIKNLISAPDTTGLKIEKARWLGRFFQKLSGKESLEDKAVYNQMMKILGNGDEEAGRKRYVSQCLSTKNNVYSEGSGSYSGAWKNGNFYECLDGWIERLMNLGRKFPKDDVRKQNKWMTDVLYVIDEQIPQGYLLNHLGSDKFIYYIDFAGFRVGDEDGDDGIYTPFVLGEPKKRSEYANGIVSVLSGKSKILPTELSTSRLSAQ